MPLYIPVKSAVISSAFGPRAEPIDRNHDGKQDGEFHYGVDFAPRGDKLVLNAHPGVVKEAGSNSVRGNFIIVLGDDGREYHYWHLAALIQSKKGLRVPARLALGIIGKTGRATGEHLHFEVRELRGGKWVAVDPGAGLGLVNLKKGSIVSQIPRFVIAAVVVLLVGGVLWASA